MRFDTPAVALLNDAALWRRQMRAGWLILVPQIIVAVLVVLTALSNALAGGFVSTPNPIPAWSDVRSLEFLSLVAACAWCAGSWLLAVQLPIDSPPQRWLARLTPVVFTFAAGMEIAGCARAWNARTSIISMLIVIVALGLVTTLLVGSRVRDVHDRLVGVDRGMRRVAGPATIGFGALALGGMIPESRTVPLPFLLHLIGAYGVIVMLNGWCLALRQERLAARFAILRLMAYGAWILAVLALLLGPFMDSAASIIGIDVVPIVYWIPLSSITLLTAVAIGVRAFHRSVRTQRFRALDILPADQVHRERLALHDRRWTITDSVATFVLLAVGTLGIGLSLLTTFVGTVNTPLDLEFGSMILMLLAIAAVSAAVLAWPLAGRSVAHRLVSATCFWAAFAMISLAAIGDFSSNHASDLRFAGDLVQLSLAIIGIFATTCLLSIRGSATSIVRVVPPLLIALASAIALGSGFLLERPTPLLALTLVVVTVVIQTITARIAPLRSRRLWGAIDVLRRCAVWGLVIAITAYAAMTILMPHQYASYDDYGSGFDGYAFTWVDWVQETAAELLTLSLICVMFTVPIFIVLIAIAAMRLHRQQARDASTVAPATVSAASTAE